MLRTLVAAALLAATVQVGLAAQSPTVLRWAGDAEGGAPYVEADPSDPSKVVGFDVEIAELIAKGLGRTPQFVEIAFASIDQSIARGDAEIGLSGIEDTPAQRVDVCGDRSVLRIPRSAQRPRRRRAAASGRWPTCGAAASARSAAPSPTRFSCNAEREHGLDSRVVRRRRPSVFGSGAGPPRRRAARQRTGGAAAPRPRPGFITQPEPVAVSHYVGVLAPATRALRDRDQRHPQARDARRHARSDFQEVERLERRSAVAVCARARGRHDSARGSATSRRPALATMPRWEATRRYLPALLARPLS